MPENTRETSASRNGVALLLATAGGVGYAPLAPGTAGSLVGVGLYLPFAGLGPWLYLLTTAGLLCLGIWAADEAERFYGREDDGRIVIDEVVGQLLALAPLALLRGSPSLLPMVTGFVAFRVLDIWKPPPVAWAERGFQGGAGVMMDDVVAGLLAASVVAAAALVLA